MWVNVSELACHALVLQVWGSDEIDWLAVLPKMNLKEKISSVKVKGSVSSDFLRILSDRNNFSLVLAGLAT